MNQWKTYMAQGAIALASSLVINIPVLAQSPAKQSSPAERAMSMLQSEAAALMGTFSGNVVVTDFDSIKEGERVVGYTAIVQHATENISLTCAVDLTDQVRCDQSAFPVTEYCSSERQQQEDIWVLQFVQNTFSSVNDYTVRLYRSING
ncbi:MAG: hypothetical protein F6K09_32915, partial [Merismopedia sp. SIO2A8]|nr:hypothetical protein [Merismopedia sp. SIO2A8]